jgi:AcrR family transcriptional regulator
MENMIFLTGSDIKDRILNNAIELLRTKGIKNITTEMIAAESGISKKTLYEVFKSKEELVTEIIDYSKLILDSQWINIFSKLKDTTETIDFLELFHELMEAAKHIFYILSTPFLTDLKKHYPLIWNNLREYRRAKIKNYFNILFKIGQESGYLRKDVSPELVYFIHYFTIDNILTPEIISEIPMSEKDVMDGILNILMTGLLTEKGSQARTELCQNKKNEF